MTGKMRSTLHLIPHIVPRTPSAPAVVGCLSDTPELSHKRPKNTGARVYSVLSVHLGNVQCLHNARQPRSQSWGRCWKPHYTNSWCGCACALWRLQLYMRLASRCSSMSYFFSLACFVPGHGPSAVGYPVERMYPKSETERIASCLR